MPFLNDLGEVPINLQILSVLNFFATGSYQMYEGFQILCITFVNRN